MTDEVLKNKDMPRFFSVAALLFSLVGLGDASYLTAKHMAGSSVPCSILNGCELVLSSQYAEFYGIPTAAFGAIAYFAAFSLVLLVFFGHSKLWSIFGVLALLMFLFSLWLVYLQAFVIGSFCQYCLLSAVTSTLLFVLFTLSKIIPSGR
jgi:uncharacterized membrane protein